MQDKESRWKVYPMFCSNCGTKLYGFKDKEGLIKYECDCCKFVAVRKEMGRRHSNIDIYCPRNVAVDCVRG